MQRYITITGNNIDAYLNNNYLILFSLRNSRIKAKKLAIMEVYFALSSLDTIFIKNGPLGDLKGVFSFFVPKDSFDKLHIFLKSIGYCDKFYILGFRGKLPKNNSDLKIKSELIWKGKPFSINNFYDQDESLYQEHSANNRKFLIKDNNNQEKEVFGYRGDGSEFGCRALPVEDARCLINLSDFNTSLRMLDPFAGGGGIIYQAKYIKKTIDVYSIDIDPVLAPGLRYYGSKHFTANSSELIFADDFFDSIVTEVPFSNKATGDIIKTIKNLKNSINKNGSLVMMSSFEQSSIIADYINELGFYQYVSQRINRKGNDVVIMAWFKSLNKYKNIEAIINLIKNVF
ncbi:TRM11 family SAM-dependent methyltransferase [Natronospora cellulosivora (SeqCode)]